MPLTRAVIDTDHQLEGSATRASEELAKHRWHWTLDESNPKRIPVREYARDVERNLATVQRYANGYALYLAKMADPPGGVAYTIQDAIRQSENSAERQEFNEAIAKGSGRAVGQVARGDNRVRTNEIIAHAKERAERRGTDPVQEAENIARHQVKARASAHRQKESKAKGHFFRWNEIEGDLLRARRSLLHAMSVGEGVDFTDEEMEFIRDAVANTRAVLDLIDLRMQGNPDIDWDGELAKLSEK